ncbi:hypothetical protein [Nocardia sp. NBC_01377]|uniref:hypothetical protein n=1 Tax=Nocardia sp. NBC_01377 TaxID=2903595 RepID=UPI00386BAB70
MTDSFRHRIGVHAQLRISLSRNGVDQRSVGLPQHPASGSRTEFQAELLEDFTPVVISMKPPRDVTRLWILSRVRLHGSARLLRV